MFKLDGGAMFGVVPKSIWNKLNPADANNLCNWAMRSLLIEEGNKLILIDNGIGDKQDDKFFSHYYLHGDDTLNKSLAQYGFHTDDITDVILTHLHFDHCGGSIIRDGDKLIPAFKNAVYWSHEQHWQWAVKPNDREKASFLKENILPIKESGQLKFVAVSSQQSAVSSQQSAISNQPSAVNSQQSAVSSENESLETIQSEISSNISFKMVHGHTAAMMLPQINYHGKTIVYVADLMPSAAHIPIPYIMGYDMFPLTTLYEKKSFLKEAIQNDYILFFEHDPVNECCSLQQKEKGIRQKDCFALQAI